VARFPSRSRCSRRDFCRLALLGPLALAACDGGPAAPPGPVGGRLPRLALPVLDASAAYPLNAAATPCLINFWATWCPPCRAEMASLNRLYRALRGRGLKVLAVAVDTDLPLVREFLVQARLDFPILLDPGGAVATGVFGVAGYPTTWLVERGGVVGDVWVGERDWDAPASRARVTALLDN
jgi:thiol-disulfide isomerase/thioredoxin